MLTNASPYILIFLTALIVNIPFGYIRSGHPKFSLKWLFWIHASIPLIIFMRISLNLSGLSIPVSIFMAVLGQIIGAKKRKLKTTQAQIDRINQIPFIKENANKTEIQEDKLLVALLNMGGPKTNSDVKAFQDKLFNDPLLIRFPFSKLLQGVFARIIIIFRLKSVEATYASMGGGSPIYLSTGKQIKALKEELYRRNRNVDVTLSFNYSPPTPKNTIAQAKLKEKTHILPLSLYPHYSTATTGSNIYYLEKEVGSSYPDCQLLPTPEYYLHNGYIQSFVDRIRESVGPQENLDDFFLLFSAHGLPVYFLTEGDLYPFQISQTVSKVLSKLDRDQKWAITYQSSVGPMQWMKPSIEAMLAMLGRKGYKKVIVVPIAFVSDHIETICEIDKEYRELAIKEGISDYRMSKAIEDHPEFISALADCVESVLPKAASLERTPMNIDEKVIMKREAHVVR